MGPQGRLVVPAAIRRELQLMDGAELLLHTDGGRLVLEPRAAAGRRLRGRYRRADGISAVDELLASRTAEAARE